MAVVLPGTTIEVSRLEKGISKTMFDGIFAAGGITLSQVSVMTGLETYLIQNWVKRGFVSSPQKRQYSKNQFARIVIINMLRESLQLDKICGLLQYINGVLDDENDDIISDSELYHMYADMIACGGMSVSDRESVESAAVKACEEYEEKQAGAKKRIIKILQVMAYAHFASLSRKAAEEMLARLD
ncbi:MAG: DUF1836 domain-containing protein [Clostridia bacterium]|nr:DUF1836 domain-containing protein [Clostridia bacterium]